MSYYGIETSRYCDRSEHDKCDGWARIVEQDGTSTFTCTCYCHMEALRRREHAERVSDVKGVIAALQRKHGPTVVAEAIAAMSGAGSGSGVPARG